MALLAHLYSHIRGSQEDIATYSLQYILSASSELNRAFTHLVSESFHCHEKGVDQSDRPPPGGGSGAAGGGECGEERRI